MNCFSWFRAGALGVKRQRTGLKLGSGSEPALELLWWKRGKRESETLCPKYIALNSLRPLYIKPSIKWHNTTISKNKDNSLTCDHIM